MTHCLGSLASFSNASSARSAEPYKAMRLTLVASNTLRIVNPPKCERSVSVKTDHFSVLFAVILPALKQETCPGGKRVCAEAKHNDLFNGLDEFARGPIRYVAQHHQLRFLLTAL